MKYVIYSNTDYLDILNVQTEYLKSIENKVLLINFNNLDLNSLYSNYSEIIFYNDEDPYATRLLNLSKVSDKYILFIHDIDILISKNNAVLENFISYMEQAQIDRIDLQVRNSWDRSNQSKIFIDNIELRKQDNENNYIYNVNPSIWKLSSLMSVMKTFSNETYRTIELMPTQLYCKQFNVYKLYSDKYINCGWFSCLEIFEFIHITHHGKLLPKVYNNLDAKLVNDYTNIIEKILKSNTNRTFSERKL
jgi:hypothetical protein